MNRTKTIDAIRAPNKRRVLWGAFLALLVPLVVLLVLQYRWLVDLERSSAIARRAKLESLLGRVTKDVRRHYVHAAERSLSFDAMILEPQYVHKFGKFFKKEQVAGASRLFVVHFIDGKTKYLLYDPETHEMVAPEAFTPELQAIVMAAAPWAIIGKKGVTVESTGLLVEERDPDHRMVMKAITDETLKMVGIAGMIIDQEYFLEHVLRKAVEESLPKIPNDEIVVVVRDDEGRQVWPPGSDDGVEKRKEIRRAFSLLFTDWHIALWGRTSTPQQWARSNFALNATLSLALAAVLLGALVLIMRTTAREMRLSEMKNDFVSNVSHELRTPLASIRVFGEFLRLGRVSSSEKVCEYGEYIETESRRLTQLINNILDFSRIESGSWAYELAPADLEEVVSDVVRTFEIRLRRSGLRLEVRPPDATLPEVRLDRDAIRQALFNLLDNAVKYSGEGREIRLRLERRRDHVVVAIEDHGIGISRPEQEKIFERFHRVSSSLIHDVKGTGLGLAIVDHIVRAHGGEVRLESEPGAGSTFSIHLPVEPARVAASANPPRSDPERPGLRLQQSG